MHIFSRITEPKFPRINQKASSRISSDAKASHCICQSDWYCDQKDDEQKTASLLQWWKRKALTWDQVESEEDEEDLHCDLSSVFFMLNDLCVNLSVSTSVCFSYFLFIQLFISNEQLYCLLPPSPLTEYHINHTERAPPSGGYSVWYWELIQASCSLYKDTEAKQINISIILILH